MFRQLGLWFWRVLLTLILGLQTFNEDENYNCRRWRGRRYMRG